MSVYRRGNGQWQVLVEVERDSAGRRRRRALGTYRSRREAERAERNAQLDLEHGIDVAPNAGTVAELLRGYVRDRRAVGRATATADGYERVAKNHIVPHLGSVPLASLKPAHVAAWRDRLLARGSKAGKPLNARTVHHAYALLHAALRWAVRMDIVARDVCRSVTPPSLSRSKARALSADEISRLLAVAQRSRWGPYVTLAFALGARRGELCALSWSDIDFETGTVTIRCSMSETRGGPVMKSTKTGRVRILPLSSIAVEALHRQRAIAARDARRFGDAYRSTEAVFASRYGRRYRPVAASDAYRKLALKAGLSSLRLHDVRHTTATTLLVSGVDVRTTAGVLGHASPVMTLNTYAHLLPDVQRAAVERLGTHIEGLAGGQNEDTESGNLTVG